MGGFKSGGWGWGFITGILWKPLKFYKKLKIVFVVIIYTYM